MIDKRAAMQADDKAASGNQSGAGFQAALALFQQGELGKAEELCDALLAADPRHFDALHLRGLIAYKVGSFRRAVDAIGAALDINPNNALAQNNRGLAFMELKQPAPALDCFDKALALRPIFAGALSNRGSALRGLGRFAEALASYDTAIAQKADFAAAWFNRGLALHDLKQHDAALESCRQALALQPDYAEAYNACGLTLKEMGQAEAALASYDKALAINPALAEAWNNRGVALQSLRQYDSALQSYDKAIALIPGVAQTWNNRGALLDHLRRYDEALLSYDKAIALDPNYANAWNNRGVTLVDLGRRAEALENYQKAVAMDPRNADAHWNMSLCHLQLGHFAEGWARHEWRWKAANLGLAERRFDQPRWSGEEPLQGKTILLHADQGLGDVLQFCRYAKVLHDRGASVVMEAPKPLANLLTGLDGVSHVIVKGEALPAFDYHCPLGSLPAAFKTDIDSIPAPKGYLGSSDDKRTKWHGRLGPKTKRRVGVVWSGNTQHKNDHNRSLPLADFVRVLTPDFEYVSLQKDVREEDRETLRSRPDIRHFGEDLADFTDTAALCDLLDVVVSVDTSVAHLAGALGRPVWILLPLNPDWRWMMNRPDSPWYASARLYRQNQAGDWASVLDTVKSDLLKFQVP